MVSAPLRIVAYTNRYCSGLFSVSGGNIWREIYGDAEIAELDIARLDNARPKNVAPDQLL